MSELKATTVYDAYWKAASNGDSSVSVYLKSEVDQVIAELEESHKKEVEQLLMEIVKLKEIDSKNRSAYYKDLAMMAKDVEHYKYKRCLKMAELCKAKRDVIIARTPTLVLNHNIEYLTRWENRWLELAEKFKEAK